MTFPRDDYTPFGYLANPYHRARSWSESEAGLLRSPDETVGFGWVEPTARRPILEARLALVIRWNGRVYQSRADFSRLGYRSRHHSTSRFSYDWNLDAATAELAFALAERDALVATLQLANTSALPLECHVFLLGQVWSRDGSWTVEAGEYGWRLANTTTGRRFDVAVLGPEGRAIGPEVVAALAPSFLANGQVAAGVELAVALSPGDRFVTAAALVRDPRAAAAAPRAAARAGEVSAARAAADDAFYAAAALPVGDWPSEWRRGWIYDLETTRACLFPAGGIFQAEWPSWMIAWPRVVLAEGTLDALRLSYAAPERALRLARTIFADAPAPNVPCLFQGGEPNMVAKDGTLCGTSPAWCLPFYNLWLLYCRTRDRRWLADLLPRLEAYLDYWLRERTDEDGWVVYKCTWEAGEDCSPRLDPAARGDEVISHVVRPVELQATLAQSAAILARFARELARPDRERRWSAVAETYAGRTQQLWDPAAGRFRDWDKRTGQFRQVAGEPTYWQTDPIRFSALSLTPLVAGIVTAEQRARLRDELAAYDAAPWCLWPSWSYVVAEAATAAGWHDLAARFAERIVRRVYASNDRRSLADAPRPTPGTAPEFWPLDLADFDGSDGYGWGATTTSLWVRQVFGFLDGQDLAEEAFLLAPGLPEDLRQPGRRFGFRRLPYRGRRLDLAYEVAPAGLEAVVRAEPATRVRAFAWSGEEVAVYQDDRTGDARFPIVGGVATRVVLG